MPVLDRCAVKRGGVAVASLRSKVGDGHPRCGDGLKRPRLLLLLAERDELLQRF
jgi:hypothetical protein